MLTGRTLFKIVLDLREADFLCTETDLPRHNQVTCRPCSIGLAMTAEVEEITWGQDQDMPWIYTIQGWTETDSGRGAISRLLALVQRHKDPIDLIAIETGRETIWA